MTRAGAAAERALRPRLLGVVERGPELEARLDGWLAGVPTERVLTATDAPWSVPGERVTLRGLRQKLGAGYDVVVLDLSRAIDADALGCAEGMVRSGGALVLVVGVEAPHDAALAVFPFHAEHVGDRAYRRLRTALVEAGARERPDGVIAAEEVTTGTTSQAALIDELALVFVGGAPEIVSIVAERGRGKSAALGLAATRAAAMGVRIAAVGSIEGLRPFAPRGLVSSGLHELGPSSTPDVVLVDEAAQIPVPALERLLHAHPRARFALATTTRGYEGTGRGYVLRFLASVRASGRPLRERTLSEPIRYAAGDPLDRFVTRFCLFDAEPAATSAGDERVERLEPERLAGDESLLRAVFGLLVHAHYRTTPNDLVRLLDAPNLHTYALFRGAAVHAVSLVAREGGFALPDAEAFARGDRRVRGHALADTLMVHAQRPEAGTLSIARSVRIATHPELRRGGLGRRLIETIHAAEPADLRGTLFGVTPEIVRFRRALGYEVVRVGASRGVRSGEPSVVMAQAVSDPARALVGALREDLARDLPIALLHLRREGTEVSAELEAALRDELPAAVPLDDAELVRRVQRYVTSAQPSSATPYVLTTYLERRRAELASLSPEHRELLARRLLEHRPWREIASTRSAAASMRALRGAVRELLERADPP